MIPAIIIIVLSILTAYLVHLYDLTDGQRLLFGVIAGVIIGIVAAIAEFSL